MEKKLNLRDFRLWQKTHQNIMTPKIVKLLKKDNTIIEISEGTDFNHKPIFGVTRVYYQDGAFEIARDGNNKLKHSLEEANEYAKTLLRSL